jgi:AAA domain (dynein-related subfamily)
MSLKTNQNFRNYVEYLKKVEQQDPTSREEYKSFISKFPANRLETLTLNDYCIGTGNKSSFCWWIERGLEKILGRYSPGTSRGHLIYFDKDEGVFKKVKELQEFDDNQALKYVLKTHAVIAQADPSDLEWIDDNEEIFKRTGSVYASIGEARKLRLLSCYHPNEVIPIASSDHCAYFLEQLGCDISLIPEYQKPISRMLLLKKYFDLIKKEIPSLTTRSFAWGLYDKDSPIEKPERKEKSSVAKDKTQVGDKKTRNGEVVVNDHIPLNQIFYGPPGTGKTYLTTDAAVFICTGERFSPNERDKLMDRYAELKKNDRIQFVTFHQSYGYEEFIEGIRPILKPSDNTEDSLGEVKYEIKPGIFRVICEAARKSADNYVIVIDEINRGNISKIFGELITLIEDDKRGVLSVTLPYSHEPFSVPKNLYIIGTMNTADRSLANVDTALRRRFHFEPMMPDSSVLEKVIIKGIRVGKLLETMNKRIEALYDREHSIGHAYFTKLLRSHKDDGSSYTEDEKFSDLQLIFKNKVIPLLEEYFFDDWSKIRMVLGDNQAHKKNCMFVQEKADSQKWSDMFGNDDQPEYLSELKLSYEVNPAAFGNVDAYLGIYQQA